MKKLRLFLGDQLNRKHSWFTEIDKGLLIAYLKCDKKPIM
jgi:hypothetical protein